MSRRKVIPVDDGSAVEIYRTESSIIYVAASYWKKGGKFSFHRLLVQSRVSNEFGAREVDVSNTLPKVQTIKLGSLDDLTDAQQAFAKAIYGYLSKSLGLKPTDKTAKHNVQFDLIIQSREEPRLVSRYKLLTWTEKRVDTFKVHPTNRIKGDSFDRYLIALNDQRVLSLMPNLSCPEGI